MANIGMTMVMMNGTLKSNKNGKNSNYIYICVFMNTMHAQVYMVTRTHIHKYDQICNFTDSTL